MRLLATLGLVVVTASVPVVQSLSGRWSAAPQPGTTITFDLSVAGTAVTGTMVVTKQDGGSATGSVEQGTMNGARFSFSVRMGGQTAAFVGELRGEEVRLRSVDNPDAPPFS